MPRGRSSSEGKLQALNGIAVAKLDLQLPKSQVSAVAASSARCKVKTKSRNVCRASAGEFRKTERESLTRATRPASAGRAREAERERLTRIERPLSAGWLAKTAHSAPQTHGRADEREKSTGVSRSASSSCRKDIEEEKQFNREGEAENGSQIDDPLLFKVTGHCIQPEKRCKSPKNVTPDMQRSSSPKMSIEIPIVVDDQLRESQHDDTSSSAAAVQQDPEDHWKYESPDLRTQVDAPTSEGPPEEAAPEIFARCRQLEKTLAEAQSSLDAERRQFESDMGACHELHANTQLECIKWHERLQKELEEAYTAWQETSSKSKRGMIGQRHKINSPGCTSPKAWEELTKAYNTWHDARSQSQVEFNLMRRQQKVGKLPGRNNFKTWHEPPTKNHGLVFNRLQSERQRNELAAELALIGVQMSPGRKYPQARCKIPDVETRVAMQAKSVHAGLSEPSHSSGVNEETQKNERLEARRVLAAEHQRTLQGEIDAVREIHAKWQTEALESLRLSTQELEEIQAVQNQESHTESGISEAHLKNEQQHPYEEVRLSTSGNSPAMPQRFQKSFPAGYVVVGRDPQFFSEAQTEAQSEVGRTFVSFSGNDLSRGDMRIPAAPASGSIKRSVSEGSSGSSNPWSINYSLNANGRSSNSANRRIGGGFTYSPAREKEAETMLRFLGESAADLLQLMRFPQPPQATFARDEHYNP